MLTRFAILALLVLAADAVSHTEPEPEGEPEPEFAAEQLCNKAAAMATWKGSRVAGGLDGAEGEKIFNEDMKKGGASQACKGCLLMMYMMDKVNKKGGHGGHRRLLDAHGGLPTGPMKCFGFDGAAAKTKATCLSDAADEAAATVCMAGFSDASTKAVSGNCDDVKTFMEVGQMMSPGGGDDKDDKDDKDHKDHKDHDHKDGNRRRNSHTKGEKKGKMLTSAMFACGGCMANASPGRRRREGHEAAVACLTAEAQNCVKELKAMDEEGEKGEQGEHASHDGHDHADGEHASGRRLLVAHEAAAKCKEEFGSDVAKIAECMAKASGTGAGAEMMKAAGDLLKGAKDGAGAGGEGMKEKAMAMGEKVMKGMKDMKDGGKGGKGMEDMMGQISKMFKGDAAATEKMQELMATMQKEMAGLEEKAKAIYTNKAPSCKASDISFMLPKAVAELRKQMEPQMMGSMKAAGMSDSDAQKMAKNMMKQIEAAAMPKGEPPAGGKTGGGDMTKEGSPTPPLATQTASPLATTTSGSGAVALSLGAVLVALLGLVQI